MKQGIKKFTAETQGARTKEGQKTGEHFIIDVLNILKIENLSETEFKKKIFNHTYIDVNGTVRKSGMSPDFIIKNTSDKKVDYIFLESKYKQISGSDWEKIESNFGFHEYFYNELVGIKSKTIVILSGYWEQCQNQYHHFMNYFNKKYGPESIYDFGRGTDEIYRFANFLNIKLSKEQKIAIVNCWAKWQKTTI